MRRSPAAAAVVLLVCSGVASAQVREDQSFSLERLRFALDRLGVLDAESGQVLPHLAFDAGMWLGIEDDPLVVYDQGSGERLGRLVDSRVAGALIGAVGLLDRFAVGVEIPFVLYQGRSSSMPGVTMSPLGELSPVRLGDVRLLPKAQILAAARHGVDLAVALGFTFPSGGAAAYAGEDGPTFVPEALASRSFGAIRAAANLGYRLRRNHTILNQSVADELFGRVAGAYQPPGARWEAAASIAGAFAAGAPFSAANQDALELLAQGGWRFSPRLLGFAGAGLGIARGYGTPDVRAFLGARFGETDADPDRDGLSGRADACPRQAEDRDGFADSDGCPDRDNDEDGVVDTADGAPLDPEDRDSFEDGDGVPDADNDRDGILDAADGCPVEAETPNGFDDADGCPDEIPDRDGDGLKDDVDRCPAEVEDEDGFEDADGCPDADNDKDTVADGADRCPLDAGVVENRGCPDTDRDGDTVVDRLDNCPDEAGAPRFQGCKGRQLAVITASKIEIVDSVYFKLNQAVIEPKSYALLDNVAAVIVAHAEVPRVRVEGHTDNQGDDASNLELSQRRAAAVVDYLVKKGVARERLEPVGYGETRPIDSNDTKPGRAKNRRVEFKILDAEGTIEQGNQGPSTETFER